MRLLNPIITVLLLFAFNLLSLFMLLIGLNGFSEDTGGKILICSGIAAFAVTIGCGALSFYAARHLETVLSWNGFLIHALCVVAFSVLGVVLTIVSYFVILFFFAEILGRK